MGVKGLVLVTIMVPCAIQLAGGQTLYGYATPVGPVDNVYQHAMINSISNATVTP